MKHDAVNSPSHYCSHPSGIEAIQITEEMNFCVGNAIKYLWRAGLKTEEGLDAKMKQIQDMQKAIWYIEREIKRITKNEQRISERILESASTQSVNEIHRTHKSCDSVVAALTCSQCNCITYELYWGFCSRCFTK